MEFKAYFCFETRKKCSSGERKPNEIELFNFRALKSVLRMSKYQSERMQLSVVGDSYISMAEKKYAKQNRVDYLFSVKCYRFIYDNLSSEPIDKRLSNAICHWFSAFRVRRHSLRTVKAKTKTKIHNEKTLEWMKKNTKNEKHIEAKQSLNTKLDEQKINEIECEMQ